MDGRKEQIRKLEEFANSVIELLKTPEAIDTRALMKIRADFAVLEALVLSNFTPEQIDMNPEIVQDIWLIKAKLNSALESKRAKHQTQIEREKISVLQEIAKIIRKLIEKLA